MSLLLRLLARIGLASAFLFPKAGTDDDPAPDDEPADEPADEPTDDDPAEDLGEDDPEPAATGTGNQDAPPRRAASHVAELRKRTQEAERKADEAAQRARDLEDRFNRQAAGPTAAERQIAEEEARLRDPNTTDMEKWQIQSNRTIRETQAQAQGFLMQGRDDRDAAAYERKAATNPTYDKYRDKVEAQVAKERAAGRLVQREMVLAYLVGQDIISGNLKSNKASTSKPIPRGKTTGARSDTPRTGRMTDAQKRAARLQDQII
jgi:hypothetical protein